MRQFYNPWQVNPFIISHLYFFGLLTNEKNDSSLAKPPHKPPRDIPASRHQQSCQRCDGASHDAACLFRDGQCSYDASCSPKSWHKRETTRCQGRMSSMPHSSASHHSSAVLEEVRSTTGVGIPTPLTRSTRSLQLPSVRASSVAITVLAHAELSKSTASLMLAAQCITSPRVSRSCATAASGLLLDTKIMVPARLEACIDCLTLLVPR